MEDRQEFEKPMFEFREKKLRSSRILSNCTTTKKTRLGDSMMRYEEIFCYYGAQKSPLDHQRSKKKKRLIRCEECGKGFRYEKCLLNHGKLMHCEEESVRKRGLLFSFSDVQRRKRSKRVSRYKRFSVSSSSFTMFPVSVDDGELLEVAESLILLSKSGENFLNGLRFADESPMDSNHEVNMRVPEHNFVGISSEFDGISRGFLGYLGDKKSMKGDESGQHKVVREGSFKAVAELERLSLEDRPRVMLQSDEQRLACQETAFEDSYSGSKGLEMNIEHRCKICNKLFSTYQALGGHQTMHRIRHKSAYK